MKRIIFSNLGLKVLAVVLAVSTWFFITYREQAEMSLDVPVGFKNVPAGLEILKQSVKNVTLTMRGHERLLKNLRPGDIGVTIDLSNAKEGEAMFYFDKDHVIAPRTVDILRIEPAHVKVAIDESIEKIVRVKPALIGAPEKGYRITSVEVRPSEVKVEGARTELARVAVLRTEPVDITGLDSDMRQHVRLNLNGRNIRTDAAEVTLIISIKRFER